MLSKQYKLIQIYANLFGKTNNQILEKKQMSNRRQIEQCVIQAAELALHRQHYVSPLHIFIGIGSLQLRDIQGWKKGKIPYLEQVIQGNLGKISFVMKCFRSWAYRKGLKPSYTTYLAKTKIPKRELQFSKSGGLNIEKAYRTHYVSSVLSERKKNSKSPGHD